MMIKKYVRGIAFVVLMLSIISVASGAPTVIVINPTNSEIITGTYVLKANVTPSANTTISSVQFYYENATSYLIGTGSFIGGFYEKSWDTTLVTNGTYTLNVTAIDNQSNVTSDTSITFSIANAGNNPPSVNVVYPNGGEIVNGTITLNASATDSDGSISSVEFLHSIDGTSWTSIGIGSASGNYYTKSWNTGSVPNNANYSIKAKATDNLGASSEDVSNSVFNVSNDVTPPGQVTSLVANNIGQTFINWTWVDPPDADLNRIEVNFGSGNISVAKGVQYYNTSSNTTLSTNTSYTFYFYTLDDNGNSNVVINTTTTLPNTPTGHVTLTFSNLQIEFSNVVASGNTSVSTSSSPPSAHGSLFTSTGLYYTVTTSANTGGNNVTMGLTYTGLIPGGYSASDLRLYRYDGSWQNITTSRDATKVYGNVTGFSTFVLGVPPKPNIIKDPPNTGSTVDTIGDEAAVFKAHSDQIANITWSLDGGAQTFNNGSMAAGAISTWTITSTKGSHNVSVTATNANGSSSASWNWTVHPKTYASGNRIWDGSKPSDYSLVYTWNPMSFYAFYYDLDSDVGNESLQVTLDSYTDRTIEEGDLKYSTTPDNVTFDYNKWGGYNVIGFMAEKYFAGFTAATSSDITGTSISPLNNKQLHKVLTDDDTKRTIYVGSTLTLSEGYVLKAKDIDITGGKTVFFSLLKDGGEVDSTVVQAGGTYVYSKRVGSVSDFPIIAVHVDTVFVGAEANAAFLNGIFQISESYTSVNTNNKYGIMEIRQVSNAGITMENDDSISLSPKTINDVMGDIKIIVADNSSVLRFAPMVQRSGTYEVRGTISTDNDTNFEWTPMNFEGFYYDIDEDVGSERMNLTRNGRTINQDNLIYTSTPQPVSFQYSNFGAYDVAGFMAEKYFAGYTSATSADITSTPISTINSRQLHRVLTDDDTRRTVYGGSTLTLAEGYVLKITDVDITGGKIVLLTLLKDGSEVDTTAVEAGRTYVYSKRVGSVSDLPIIALHVETVFVGREANAAFIRGVFQISESYTTVKSGDTFGVMKVSTVSGSKIEMKNDNSISLSEASTIDVMGRIKFKVADDSSAVRFYPFIIVNGSILAANQLGISVPSNLMERDIISITVTAGAGTPIEGAEVSYDGNVIGTTNTTGQLEYTLTSSGTHNITATKLGYERAVKTIQVATYVNNRLSFEIPSIIDQAVPVSIKVHIDGQGIPGTSITLDNDAIGTTDANGVLNYTFDISGTHNLGASKTGYVSVISEISIRMPFSEFRALDINITPTPVHTNEEMVVMANITNAGTKADTRPVELLINNTVTVNQSVMLAPGEVKEINFTGTLEEWMQEDVQPGNYTVEILGQKKVIEATKSPLNLFLIGGILTGLGAIMIYIFTAKGKISMEAIRNLNWETIRSNINAETIRRKSTELGWKLKDGFNELLSKLRR